RRDLYGGYSHLTEVLSKTGRNAEVEALAGKALRINEELVREFPNSADYRLDLGSRYLALAEQNKEPHPVEAEQAYRRALAIHEQLAADFPGQSPFLAELTKSREQLISFQRNTGKSSAEIEKLYRQAIACHEKAATNSPYVPHKWQQLARTHNALGIFLR